jgi:hypothetical protein
LTATQLRLTQSDAGAGDRDVLDHFVLPVTARARHRLGVRFHDGCTDDRHRSFWGAARLELEQALTGLPQLALRAFGFTPLASWSRFLSHVREPTQ